MKYLTVTAQLSASTDIDHWRNPTLDEVCVNLSDLGHMGSGLWAADPDDLERLAAECIAAANALRASREAAA